MPFPNEHEYRLQDPGKYDTFSRIDMTSVSGKKFSVIIGTTKNGESGAQSYRYGKDSWTEKEAREHDRGGRNGTFEPALKSSDKNRLDIKLSQMETKEFPFELKDFDDRRGTFDGMLSTNNNVDPVGDRFLPGVWKRTLSMKNDGRFPLLKNHDFDFQLGSFVGEDKEEGLYIRGRLNLAFIKNSEGKEIAPAVPVAFQQYELYKAKDAKGLSVGFRAIRGGTSVVEENGRIIRQIKEAELIEGSMTPFPMNIRAQVGGIKSFNDALAYIIQNLADEELKYKIFSLYGYGPEDLSTLESRKKLTPGPENDSTRIFDERFVRKYKELGG